MSLSQPVLIDIIAGARPNFVKVAAIIRAQEARKEQGSRLRHRLVHTGQAALAGPFDTLFENRWKKGGIPEKWDGRAGERIVGVIEQLFS